MNGTQRTIVTLSVALAVSLCGNAFMAGRLGAHKFGPPPPGLAGPDVAEPRVGQGLRGFLRDLPPEVREQVAQGLRGGREQMGAQMRALGQARRASAEALRAEPFDPARLEAALAAQRTEQERMQALVHERMVSVLGQLTPEQRSIMGENIGRVFR